MFRHQCFVIQVHINLFISSLICFKYEFETYKKKCPLLDSPYSLNMVNLVEELSCEVLNRIECYNYYVENKNLHN